MNSSQAQAELSTFAATVLHVMETAVFALADEAEDPTEAQLLDAIAVGIDLGKDMQSRIEIAGPLELFAELAADMMGADVEEISPEQAADFLSELANMIAGRWATDALGDQAEVALGIPEPIAMNDDVWEARLGIPGCFVFTVNDHYLIVDLAPRLA